MLVEAKQAGRPKSRAEKVGEYVRGFAQDASRSAARLLPLVFRLKGKPLTLDDHFPFEPFFRPERPPRMMVIAGRQVGKSLTKAAASVLFCWMHPHVTLMSVTPLYEQARRYSQNYIKPLIRDSLFRRNMMAREFEGSVLQQTYRNGAKHIFSFAKTDADRTRGVPADALDYDEIQDMLFDLIPVISASTSGSREWRTELLSGTAKTTDNTANVLFQESSGAEWATKCPQQGCGHWNIAGIEHDLYDMVGPANREISAIEPGTICTKCGKPLSMRRGHWLHARHGQAATFPGYHIPQIILPQHNESRKDWTVITAAKRGAGGITKGRYLNEYLGVAWDIGAKLVTEAELKAAAVLPWSRKPVALAARGLDRYALRVCAVDWGGAGEARTSFTAIAVLGVLPDGRIDVIWGTRVEELMNDSLEADTILTAARMFRCDWIAHDYGTSRGGGEYMLRQRGWPAERVVRIRYGGSTQLARMLKRPVTASNPREWFLVTKGPALSLVCQAVRERLIRFFRYDYESSQEPGLIRDFLALQENVIERDSGANVYQIGRDPTKPDDFAQAVTYGAHACWHLADCWPSFALDTDGHGLDIDTLNYIQTTNINLDTGHY